MILKPFGLRFKLELKLAAENKVFSLVVAAFCFLKLISVRFIVECARKYLMLKVSFFDGCAWIMRAENYIIAKI